MAKKIVIVLLFLYMFSKSRAQSPQSNNITTGSTLYANTTPNFWPSPSGHFAFGFYPSGDGFKVGIWLVGSPANNTIVVWTARRNDPVVSSGASLQFFIDGSRVLLRDSNGEVQLIALPTQRAVGASMLDSGNFVLYDSRSEIVWASFDEPTDTLLVGQKLVPITALRPSVSLTNLSVGNFELWMEDFGSLVAFPQRIIRVEKYAYWSSDTSDAGNNVTLMLDQDSRLYLVKNLTGFVVKNFTEGGLSVNRTTLYRASLDVDGIFRLYQHQIGTNGSLNSMILWAAINEENRCAVKGTCGLNSYCTLNGATIACLCPPGFVYLDQQRPQDGCQLNSTLKIRRRTISTFLF